MNASLNWFLLGHGPKRCLACGSTLFESDPEVWMCSDRYTSPHGEDFLQLVAEELDQMGALREDHDPSQEEHDQAIGKARAKYAV